MNLDDFLSRPSLPPARHPGSVDFPRIVAVVVPLLGIVGSELFLYLDLTDLALSGHALTLIVCTVAPLWIASETELFTAFAFVPLFRLVNLGMPVFFDLTVLWFPLIYAPLIPSIYLLARRETPFRVRPEREVRSLGWLPFGLLLAILLSEVEYWVLSPESLVPTWSLAQVALLAVVMIGFVGLVEELIFRGVLQRTLQAHIGRWAGLALASAVFGMMHSGYGSVPEIVLGAFIGFIFGLLYDVTDSISLVAITHGVLNVFLFGVLPVYGSLLERVPDVINAIG